MRKNFFVTLLVYVFVNICIVAAAFLLRNYFNIITWLSLIQVLLIICTINYIKRDYLQIGIVFIFLTYLFHFGQAIIKTFWVGDRYSNINVISMTSESSFITGELFAMSCLFLIGCGYLYASINKKKINQHINFEYTSNKLQHVRKIALCVFFVTVLPMVYIDIFKILALKSAGYEATYAVYRTGIGVWLNLIGQFCKPVIAVILYSYYKDIKKARLILFVFSTYYVVMMLSGDRGTNMIYLITLFLVYFIYVKRPNIKTIIFWLFPIYFMLAVISAISIFRYTNFSFEAFLNALIMRNDDGIIYSTLREFGGSMLSLVYSVDYIPNYSSYNYGLTYIAALFTVTPVLPNSIADLFSTSFAYTEAFPLSRQYSLGGSFLGELYYNFGWFSPFFATLIGNLLGKLDIKIGKLSNPRIIATVIVLLPSLFLWVRDFVSIIVFKTFWLGLLFMYIKLGESKKNEESINNHI